jgi:hypothetical protein
MNIIFTTRKGRHLVRSKDIMEVYLKPEKGVQINDKTTITKNRTFYVIVTYDSQ